MEIKSEVTSVNFETETEVLNAIDEAKGKGWSLFPPEQLKKNALEWEGLLLEEIKKYPSEYLEVAKRVAKNMPLIHVVDPEYAYKDLNQGYVATSSEHKGKGRSAKYETALGLSDYVFLSTPTWKSTEGASFYFHPDDVLDNQNTVVTLMDQARLAGWPFSERVSFYQHCAFSGPDFKRLLPYFLVLHFGDLNNLDNKKKAAVDGYPDWYIESFGEVNVFHPEIKVKDRLPVTERTKIGLRPGLAHEGDIKNSYPNKIVDIKNESLDLYLTKGQEWWGG